ncbi:hypothetical protein MKQ68_19940 [Chitinophaga horti]|uniref:Na+-driven multidrug efflux pump n=1 Tax=Chitinophaga horti TaxID=2920382 RepID=A0ABY6IY98_9BACT|nr:MATE family efflux transporter [Chitinophaga horti]UYQ92359.1 hypothetical protein MKQ68_19940 [Chitinophaga horti]
MQAANRVVINTGTLYGKMLITIVISLYSTRLVLNALGANDFGLFNLISGVIAMLSFVNMAMTLSTQRYMSYSLGGGDTEQLKKVFNSSVLLHFVLGLILVTLFELVGIYMFDHVLNIPPDRLQAAKVIYHLMVASAFFTVISVPYDAVINARENMMLVAITGILESLLKLGIAVYLQYAASDKLVLFAGFSAGITVAMLLIKRFYCIARYEETRIRIKKYFSKSLLKEMFGYGGWNMFGAVSVVARNQGIAMILNVFFGTVVNAAYGIANQVNAQLSFFSVTMLQSLNPQIIKSEGRGDRERMLRLAMIASKFSFSLLAFFAIPAIIEMPFILQQWLKDVPTYTVVFCRLILLATLVNQLSQGIQVGVQSVGRIGAYQVTVSILLMMNLPIAYLLLWLGLPPQSVLVAAALVEVVTCAYRMMAGRRLIGLQVEEYFQKVVVSAVVPVFLAACISALTLLLLPEGWLRLMLTCVVSVISITLFMRYLGLTAYELEKLKAVIVKALTKINPRFALVMAGRKF